MAQPPPAIPASRHDLGQLSGPVLIFGGPYSNLPATETLLAEADRRGIPAGNIICTGDTVAYCAEPQETVDRLRAAGLLVVMGNCEESLGRDADDCGCGFQPGTTCDRLSAAWFRFASAALDGTAKAWMVALPRRIDFTLAGRRFAVVHGGPSQINRFIFASTPAAEKRRALDLAATDAVIGGHCGLPFSQLLADGRLWHNAGVIGMPANDATPRVWFSLLTPLAMPGGASGIRVEHLPLTYDHAAAARAMVRHRLPAEYRQALQNGLWDNNDVLPAAETRAKGNRLVFTPLLWPAA